MTVVTHSVAAVVSPVTWLPRRRIVPAPSDGRALPRRSSPVASTPHAGGEIAMVPVFLASHAIERDDLLRVLPDRPGGVSEINIVHLSQRLMALRLRVFIDVLLENFPDRSLIGLT